MCFEMSYSIIINNLMSFLKVFLVCFLEIEKVSNLNKGEIKCGV